MRRGFGRTPTNHTILERMDFEFVIPTGSPSFLSRSWDVPIDKGHNLFLFSSYIIPNWSGKVKLIRIFF